MVKGFLAGLVSLKGGVLLSESKQGANDLGKAFNESTIEITEIYEALHLLEVSRHQSIDNDSHFFEIHAYSLNEYQYF